MTNLIQPHISDREADRRAREWSDSVDPQAAVGARHHIVPKFLLARFASAEGQLRVRNRADGKSSVRAISDLAVRDFYTAVTKSASLDSSLESLLSIVEGATAEVLRQHLDFQAFAKPRFFTEEERATLDVFVAMQAVRGMRTRRGLEVLTDYSVKLLNEDKISAEDVLNTDFVPHPNEHLEMFGVLAERVEVALKARHAVLLRLDKPLLIVGDEPVLVVKDQDQSGFGGLGFNNAGLVTMPTDPSTAIMYGPPGVRHTSPEIHLEGAEAVSFADEHNTLMVHAAIDWVAARPDHPEFDAIELPQPSPLLTVQDGGTPAGSKVNSTPARRPIRRVRREDILDISTPEDGTADALPPV